jgi:phosphoesterase RecJ-like protein
VSYAVAPVVREGTTEAITAIKAASSIVLACHINPDGDAIGSLLALGLALQALHKEIILLSSDGVPPTLAFLPGSERIVTSTEKRGFDLAIVVDSGELKRVGTAEETILSAGSVVNIDHHVVGNVFGDVRLLDGAAAATCEILYDLITALGVEIESAIAENLLCGIQTDTGNFRYLNVTPHTMLLAADLISRGAIPDRIAENVFENRPFAAQKLLGCALESLQVNADGCVAWAIVTREDFARCGATDTMTDGFISQVRSVRGVEIALLLRQMDSGKIRVSLRSCPPFDVSRIAAQFGGGGHRLASGCTLEGDINVVVQVLVAAAQEELARSNAK